MNLANSMSLAHKRVLRGLQWMVKWMVVVDSHSGEKGGAKLSHKGLPMDGWIPGHIVRKRVVHRRRSPTRVE